MALKHKISADDFSKLPDALKTEYKIQADMSYQLDLGEGVFITDRDPTGLFTALEKEREETKRAKAAADRLEAEKKQAELSKLTDVEQIKQHFQKELDERDKRYEAERKAAEKDRLQQQSVAAESARKAKALEIASGLFGTNAPLMLPHVEMALRAVPGESPKVEIIDPVTNLPALDQNFDNWKRNLSTNPLFAPMIVVSKSSGGSANGGKSNGIPGVKDDGKPKAYSDYKPSELMALKKEQPELFKSLHSQHLNKG